MYLVCGFCYVKGVLVVSVLVLVYVFEVTSDQIHMVHSWTNGVPSHLSVYLYCQRPTQ